MNDGIGLERCHSGGYARTISKIQIETFISPLKILKPMRRTSRPYGGRDHMSTFQS
jgi:hypothetical protein